MSWSVLIVNDEPMTRNILQLMLKHVDFKLFEAEDGVDALNQVRQNRPDVLIFDVMTATDDGIAGYDALCCEAAAVELPMIVLSAKTQLRAIEQGMRDRVGRCLSKPVSRSELIMSIREAVGAIPAVQPAMAGGAGSSRIHA